MTPTSARSALARLRRHAPPAWWLDAKLGVFVHWTPASVPGWAPVDREIGEVLASGEPNPLAHTPYTEWYENSLRFPDSPVSRYHRETFGDRAYASFAGEFEAALDAWDPDAWARRFRDAGARYVVLVSKHHDGFCLWPSAVTNPGRAGWHTRRDVVGELAEAVRGAGMRFGLYYSGGLDWTFNDHPIGNPSDLSLAQPRGAYLDYAEAHVQELVDRYRPSVLWNDISWPGHGRRLWDLFDRYYRAVPDGIVNDRFLPWSPVWEAARFAPVRRVFDAGARRVAARSRGIIPPRPPLFDFRTPEYVSFTEVARWPWECVRGIDRSFGYNRNSRPEHFLPRDDLERSFIDIVAKGGNLMINVGPRGEDATIPDEQLLRLAWLGELCGAAGAGLYGTRPWVRAEARSEEGHELRFTARASSVFVHVLSGGAPSMTIGGLRATAATTARVHGTGHGGVDPTGSAVVGSAARGLRIEIGAGLPAHAVVELRDVEAAPS